MHIICGSDKLNNKTLPPYSDMVCDFLDAFSAALRNDPEAKSYPDVMTFAFWARTGSIQKKKEDFLRRFEGQMRIGKGTVFHIAPSNVPVNCMFTYAFGLLAGNSNIVRIPTKEFPQVQCMCRVLDGLFGNSAFSEIKEMTLIVSYDRSEREYTENYSKKCDMRVIWGGDDTIRDIRSVLLPPRSTEITFADRYSFGVIDADAVDRASDEELRKLAEAFYNDTYLMDQNACSAPHLICWKKTSVTNEVMQNTQKRFWDSIYSVAQKYDLADIKASDKYTDLCDKVMRRTVSDVERYDNLLYVCKLSQLPQDVVMSCRGRYGMFFEYEFSDWDELSVLSDTRVQTCAVFGVDPEEVAGFITDNNIQGIDRIVPFGKTLEIDTVWDGYDLIGSMSRVIGY